MRIAGDKLNQDIISTPRGEFKLLLGEKTAEDVGKMSIGSVVKNGEKLEAAIRGRDMVTGLPREGDSHRCGHKGNHNKIG